MKSIMTIPPAPHIHHIGCIPEPQSGTRSWPSAAAGARAAPDPTSHHLARRNIIGPPLLTSSREDATIADGRALAERLMLRGRREPCLQPAPPGRIPDLGWPRGSSR